MDIKVICTTIIVKSLSETVDYYKNVLGFKEGYHVDFPFGGLTLMEGNGGSMIELIEAPQFPLGLYSVGTDVEDLDAAIAEITAKGGKFVSEIVPTTVGRQIFLEDNNGIRICLIEHNKEYKEKYLSK